VERPCYIPLRCHSEYSLAEGIVPVKKLVEAAAKLGYPALGLTDDVTQFAALKFEKAAVAAGVKPLHGVDLMLRWGGKDTGRATLLCLSDEGMHNLALILTRMQISRVSGAVPVLDLESLSVSSCAGIVMLAGHLDGLPGRLAVQHQDEFRQLLCTLQGLFADRLYLEISKRGLATEDALNEAVLACAQELALPVVVADPVYMLERDDYETQEIRSAIAQGRVVDDPGRVQAVRPVDYLPTQQEIQDRYADFPEALQNTVELGIRLTSTVNTNAPELPHMGDAQAEAGMLRDNAQQGLDRLAAAGELRAAQGAEYQARLDYELGVITKMGFPGYFLIVADFISWARTNGVPVGPGRGSGAGSLVAYVLGITQLDPLAHGLLFERFLNPERVSLPDLDIDFCIRGRDRVVRYVYEKYGHANVGQIVTFGRMTARAVVKDVARALGFAYELGDRMSRLIPGVPGMTLAKAIADSEDLRRLISANDDSRQVVEVAKKLEGLPRQAGTHAGGVIISGRPLTDYCPLYSDGHAVPLTQFDMNDAESAGLVKFDFLGLKTLTVLHEALDAVNRKRAIDGESPLRFEDVPLQADAVYADLAAGRTSCIFQLESRGMTELIKRFKPTSFEDLTALIALFRPGPLQSGMVDDFIARKDGLQPVQYPHPSLEPILKATHGVILYQEQVTLIAQVLAGYSLGKADLLRKAMGKKKPEEMARQRAVFMAGATGKGIDGDLAAHIFDLMEKFAGYGFNKSHSAAYALVGLWCAWLKHYYPAEMFAAAISHEMDDDAKASAYIADAIRVGVVPLPPDVNDPQRACVALADGRIRLGLLLVSGVGESVVSLISSARKDGPYLSITDLAVRVPSVLDGGTLEALVKSGACDALGSRGGLLEILDQVRGTARQHLKNKERSQTDMFGSETGEVPEVPCPSVELSQAQRCWGERQVLGFFLSGHPAEAFAPELAKINFCPLAEADHALAEAPGQALMLGGYVTKVTKIRTRNGRPMATVDVHDSTGALTVVVFPELFQAERAKLEDGQVVFFAGRSNRDQNSGEMRLSADKVLTFNEARAAKGSGVVLELKASLRTDAAGKKNIMSILKRAGAGSWPVSVRYSDQPGETIPLGDGWTVKPSRQLLDDLGHVSNINVSY
jgi:DNA polymerase III subunit alpha